MTSLETTRSYHHGDLRNALIGAAGQVLTAKGSAGLSLREVAKVAGVSHAAPYRHFRDKAALLRTLAQGGFERLAAAIATVAGSKPHNPEQKLIEAGVVYVRLAVQNPAITQLMFGGTLVPQHDNACLKAAATAYEFLLGIIQEGVALGVGTRGPCKRHQQHLRVQRLLLILIGRRLAKNL